MSLTPPVPPTPPIAIRFFGPVQIEHAGTPTSKVGSQKSLVLLAYLIRHPYEQSRSKLATVLWPDQSQSKARANLRWALNNLSGLLPDCFVATRQTLCYQPTTTSQTVPWVDIIHFRLLTKHLPENNQLLHQPPTIEMMDQQESQQPAWWPSATDGVNLYRGEFLEGISLDDAPELELWLTQERELWRRRVVDVLELLINDSCQRQEFTQAEPQINRLLAIEPWHEIAHQRLIWLLAETGRRTAALAQYEQCKAILADELGVEPTAATTELYRQIRAAGGREEQPIAVAGHTPAKQPAQPPIPHNLPRVRTPLVGRTAELTQICELLTVDGRPLVTLLGEGGMGKTRLALAVADALLTASASAGTTRFVDGLWYVALAGVWPDGQGEFGRPHAEGLSNGATQSDEAYNDGASPMIDAMEQVLITAIGTTLNLIFSGGLDPRAQLIDYLRNKQLLLVLDNFEHLLDSALFLSDLLADAAGVQILVTSRSPLRLQEEWRVPLQGLDVPTTISDPKALTDHAATALYLQSAKRLRPDFQANSENLAAIVATCRYVNGLPLAIELATTMLMHMNSQALADALISPDREGSQTSSPEPGQGLDLLQSPLRNVPTRHRHIRNVFGYSWRLLAEREQQCAIQVALCHGGGDRTALQAITEQPIATLTALVNHSLVQHNSDGRYAMHGLLRQFCLERLAQEQSEQLAIETQNRHSRYYLRLVAAADQSLKGETPQPLLGTLRQELDNIRQAWQWAQQRSDWSLIRTSRAGLIRLYSLVGLLREGQSVMGDLVSHLRQAIAAQQKPTAEERVLLAQALIDDAHFCNAQANYTAAIANAAAVHELSATGIPTELMAAAELRWGEALWYQGEIELAQPRIERALALLIEADKESSAEENTSIEEHRADALCVLGLIAVRKGNYQTATSHYTDSHQRSLALADAYRTGRALYSLGTVYRNRGEYTEAQRFLEQALTIAHQTGDRHSESRARNTLGDIYLYRRHHQAAQDQYAQVAQLASELGDRRSLSIAQTNLGIVARELGDYTTAQQHFQASLALARTIGFPRGEGWNLCCLSLLCHQTDRPKEALAHATAALALFTQLGDRLGLAYSQMNLGRAYTDLAAWDEAEEAYSTTLALRRELAQPHLVIEVMAGLATVAHAQGNVDRAMTYVEEILVYLERATLEGMEEPKAVLTAALEILEQQNDQRAARLHRELRQLQIVQLGNRKTELELQKP